MTPARITHAGLAPARAAGDAALLLDAPGAAAQLAAAISAAALPGVLDIVPGAVCVLVVTEPGRWDLADLERRIRALPLPDEAGPGAREVEIPVRYDGADLAAVADLTGLSVAEVAERHQASRYRVGWMGFSPGFGYLTGLDPVLAAVPRLATPRPSVPAGSVAIAGGLAAVYPAPSPGGWRLLGRTQARLWDARRQPPALLAPGTPVRFRAVPAGSAPALPPATADPGASDPGASDPGASDPGAADPGASDAAAPGWTGPVEVLRTGPLATIQDLGRPGYAHLGVPHAGAADPGSLRRANRLVGNADGAAGLEVTLGRLQLRFHAAAVVAVTGAPAAVSVTTHGGDTAAAAPGDRAIDVPAGAVLKLAAPADGLRSYLAIRGGIDVPPELGSRSADLLSGLGPRPLRPGDRLPVGAAPPAAAHSPAAHSPAAQAAMATAPPGDSAPPAPDPPPAPDRPAAAADSDSGAVTLRIVVGPRDDWFSPAARDLLTSADYQVTPTSNRTGLRLSGPELARARPGELPSEGMVAGALQVPPDGQPILLLADHGTTGGYPVIAVVHSADIGRAAQLRPGRRVRFRLAAADPRSKDGDGTAPSGTAPSGTAPGGTAPGGTAPGGTAPGGTAPGDTAPGGTADS
jgi:KipI family sensor histidine kinase inhibitor